MKDIIALDQGTTSSRALRFDPSGALKALKQREFEQHFPQPGWVEHDPLELWETQVAVLEEVLTPDVGAIGISNQRETTLLWERDTGKPLHRAIVWQDRRTAPLLASMEALAPLVRERTGLLLDPYFSAAKLRWLLDELPGARGRAERGELAFGTVDSWLIWNLTDGAVHATDVTNASRTSLFDIHKRQWDAELLDAFAIPPSVLPEVRESAGEFGEYKGIPIRGVAGDQQAALFGQGCVEAGMAKCTYGTGCFLLMHTGEVAERSPHLLTTLTCDGGYALEGSVFMGGAIVEWLRKGLGIIGHASEVEALARSVKSSEGVFLVPAFTGLGAPHWDPHARAAILGLNRGSTAAHIARAALEAIALQVAELIDRPLTELRADGAAARDDLLMQLQADQLGTPLLCPQLAESSALGAARLAGLSPAAWQLGRRFEPEISRDEAASKLGRWQEAVAAVRSFH